MLLENLRKSNSKMLKHNSFVSLGHNTLVTVQNLSENIQKIFWLYHWLYILVTSNFFPESFLLLLKNFCKNSKFSQILMYQEVYKRRL